VSKQELNLFDLSAGHMAQLRTGSAQIVWSEVLVCVQSAHLLTTYQMTFSDMPLSQGVPCGLTALNTLPWPKAIHGQLAGSRRKAENLETRPLKSGRAKVNRNVY
jgi:hypothetical protein